MRVIATATVIDRNPGEPFSYKEMGLNKLYLGETQEAAEWFRRADAIAPHDPDRWMWLQGLGRALMQLGHDAEAVDALSQAMDSNPNYLRGRRGWRQPRRWRVMSPTPSCTWQSMSRSNGT